MKGIKRKDLLPIGTMVIIEGKSGQAEYRSADRENPILRSWIFELFKDGNPRIGVVTGLARRFEGEYEPERLVQSHVDEPTYEQPYLNVKGSKLFYRVRLGYLNRELLVPLHEVRTITTDYKLPILFVNYSLEYIKRLKELANDPKATPRNEKGDFI